MYTQASQQIRVLLDAGQDTQAHTLFMAHLAAHCRDIDQVLGKVLGQNPYTNELLWQRFQTVHRTGCFTVSDEIERHLSR